MKFSDITINIDAIEAGRWVSVDHLIPGVKLKVRGIENTDYKRLRNKLISEISRPVRLRGVDLATMEKINTTLLVEAVLVDWSGIEDDDGQPLPFSKEKAASVLSDPGLVVFRNAVEWAASIVGEDDLVEAEAAAKN